MQHPKVVVIGAGSLFFGRQSLWNMIKSPVLSKGTLAYVDTNRSRLERMVKLGRMMAATSCVGARSRRVGMPVQIEGSTDRRKVLKGADFVVLSFANEGVKYRGVDCRIAEKYGVRMCSGDTIGPGGIFRAMRELPEILRVAKDVERLCPDAWVINYINPTTVNGIGLMRHAPRVKSFAMCDSFHMPMWKRNFMVSAGVAADPKDITPKMEKECVIRHAGLNHFPWLLSATFRGKDIAPGFRQHLEKRAAAETAKAHAKEVFNSRYALALWDLFGLCPLNLAHTKEYVRYWQGKNVAKGALPALKVFNAAERQLRHDAMWKEVDDYLAGSLPPEHFFQNHSQDHATDVIESMWGALKKRFVVSSPNRGAVTNMDDDAFLELLSDIDMNGPRPLPVGALPPGIRAMEQTVLETHELTVEAIATCDREVLRRAMALDPLVPSIDDADAMIAELLRAERSALPACWF